MQKISQNICLIVLLVLVATSCMAQAAAIQDAVGGDVLHHLIHKRCSSDTDNCCLGNLLGYTYTLNAPGNCCHIQDYSLCYSRYYSNLNG
jgi:hypothetical protein